ncbi:MAG TPA: response regulator [bacterium]|nr:response regulator [bacterium]
MTPGSESQRIVVADDDLLLSSRVSASLERLGYRAVVVRSAAALETAIGNRPDAVIVNLAARRFDAPAAIRRIKGDGTTRAIPLLGFCGHRDTERARAAVAAGCDAVTTNGVITADLSRALKALLDSARPASGTA